MKASDPTSAATHVLDHAAPAVGPTTGPTVVLNAAFFQEIKEDNVRLQHLLREIRELFEDASRRRAMAKTAALLGELRDELALHFALEEAYGYFEDAVNMAPELAGIATLLRSEHGPLYTQIRDIAERAEQCQHAARRFRHLDDLIVRTRAFCDQLDRHEHRENELILRAYDDDVGVGD